MSDIKWKQEEFELLWKDKESWKQEDGTYICPVCDRKCSKHGIKNHLKEKHFDYSSWNKGLTKETDERIKKYTETYRESIKEGKIIPYFTGKKLSDEHRKKLSEKRILNMESNNVHCKFYEIYNGKNYIKVQGTWEKNVAEYLNKNNIYWERKCIEYNCKKYTPDFFIPSLNTYIEIKGWMKFRDIIKMHYFLNNFPNIKLKIIEGYREYITFINGEISIDDLKYFTDKYPFENLEIYKTEYFKCLTIKGYKKLEMLKIKEKIIKEKYLKKINMCHEIAIKINQLIDSDIDFTAYGWVSKASKIIGISSQKIRNWIERNYPKLLEEVFSRK